MVNLKGNVASTHKNFEIVQLPQRMRLNYDSLLSSNPDGETSIQTQYYLHPSMHLSTTPVLVDSEQSHSSNLTPATSTSFISGLTVLQSSPHISTATALIERGHELGSSLQNTIADAVDSVSLLHQPKSTVLRPGDSPQSLSLTNRNLGAVRGVPQ